MQNVRTQKSALNLNKLSDGGGLYLEIIPSGGKYWRMKYRFAGKEKRLAFGVYPVVPLSEARDRRDEARKMLLSANRDPAEAKKEAKRLKMIMSDNTFEVIAREWYEMRKHEWVTSYQEKMILRLDEH